MSDLVLGIISGGLLGVFVSVCWVAFKVGGHDVRIEKLERHLKGEDVEK